MTRRSFSWLISSATAALLAMAITLFPVQGFAANRTGELAGVRSQSSPIDELTISSQLIGEYPQTHQFALTIKDSSDKAITLQQSEVYSTTTSGYQINLPLILTEPDERAALMALYESTGGNNWVYNSGWNTISSICTWYGVTCDSAGHVTSLILTNNGLEGYIPPEIGNLVNLNLLKIIDHNYYCTDRGGCFGSDLSGSIPPEIGNLVNLQELDLYNNQLEGSIPPEIGNLVNLQSLNLAYNFSLSGPIPPEIGNLVNLQKLDIYSYQLSGPIPPEIGNLVNLQKLDIYSPQLSGPIPPEIGNLANLQ